MKRNGYTARLPDRVTRYSPDQLDFLRRRTAPFLDRIGVDKPISHLLQEAYLQGVRDTADALSTDRGERDGE